MIITTEKLEEARKYWLEKLKGNFDEVRLLPDFQGTNPYKPADIKIPFSENITGNLLRICKNNDLSIYVLLLTAFRILLYKYTGQKQIILLSPIYSKSSLGYNKTVLLKDYLSPAMTFKEFLIMVNQTVVEGYKNQYYPYRKILNLLDIPDISPFSSISLLFENIHEESNDFTAGLVAEPGNDITFSIMKNENVLECQIIYNSNLYKKDRIETLFAHYASILDQSLVYPSVKLCNIEVIRESEKQKMLRKFNTQNEDFPESDMIHTLFENQAEKKPGNTAVVNEDKMLTYGNLNGRANKLAALLEYRNVKVNSITGILLERRIDWIISLMAVLKVGGAYLPVDADLPTVRQELILKESGAMVLLTRRHISDEKPGLTRLFASGNILFPDDESLYSRGCERPNPVCRNRPEDLLYVIYTSGSTGIPKGVLIRHRGFVNLLHSHKRVFAQDHRDLMSQVANLSFDAAYFEIWPCLTSGARLIIANDEIRVDPRKMKNWLIRNRITISFQPTVIAEQLMGQQWPENGISLRILRAAGDRLRISPSNKIPFDVYNLYGPTEDTVWSTWHKVDVFSEHHDTPASPGVGELSPSYPVIGKPVGNHNIYIMDSDFKMTPPGAAGELCISGEGLARGYLNRPELTAERFINSPVFDGQPQGLPLQPSTNELSTYNFIYKTGDLARWLPGGDIEFLGRIDNQVKIRGYRVEVGEIEAQLMKQDIIEEAVVVSREDPEGGKYLCAYVVPGKVRNREQKGEQDKGKQGEKEVIDIRELKKKLSGSLPDYMVPAFFVQIDKIPLTANGKIDKKSLPEPVIGISDTYVAPRNEVEKILARVWAEVLRVVQVGVKDNFFDMGGDSIKAIQAESRMNKLGYKFEMRDIFRSPSIAELAVKVKKLERIPDQAVITGQVELTPIQTWFFENINSHHFNQSVLFYSRERTSEDLLRSIFSKINSHHDALRMIFRKENGKLLQFNRGLDSPVSLQVYDYTGRESGPELLAEKLNEIQAGIDLESGPLMKLGLFHLEDGDRLLITIHHLVVDGVSWRILVEDIGRLYGQHIKGEPLSLDQKTDSYKVWAEKLPGYANTAEFLREKQYWSDLESQPVPRLPGDFSTETGGAGDRRSETTVISVEETGLLLTGVNHAFHTNINDILLLAFGLGLEKCFGIKRVAVALESHGRENIIADMDISRTVGWFTALYPVILDIYPTEELSRQIKEIKERLHRVPNSGSGYAILRYLTLPENKQGIEFKLSPQISFNYLGRFDLGTADLPFEIAPESSGNSLSPNIKRLYDLDVSGMIVDRQLSVSISYSGSQYRPGTIRKLMGFFKEELSRIISYCSRRQESELTPIDLSYSNLSLAELDMLIEKYSLADIYPLSHMQEGIYFHDLYNDSSPVHFGQVIFRMTGNVEIESVEKSLNGLIKRYDILRTNFVQLKNHRLLQVVQKERSIDLFYEDISAKNNKEQYLNMYKEKERRNMFNLSEDLLVRVAIFYCGNSHYEFTWSHHHILLDGWCIGILLSEFVHIYHSILWEKTYELPPVTPYREYIEWLERQDEGRSKKYWQEYLSGFEAVTGLPGKTAGETGRQDYVNETFDFEMDGEKTNRLSRLAASNRVTVNNVMQTVWGILLGKYTGKQDVLFGSVVSGRPADIKGIETMVGLFINTIPVRITFDNDMTFIELLRQVQHAAVESEPFHYYPLARIQAESVLKGELLDHILAFVNYPIAVQVNGAVDKNKEFDNRCEFEISDVEEFEQSSFDLNIRISANSRLKMEFRYNAAVYAKELIKKITAHLEEIIEQVVDNQNIRLHEIGMSYDLSDAEAEINKEDYLNFPL